jgi:enamine deaminase RidA (YjgF/YER057c/UK114 family)
MSAAPGPLWAEYLPRSRLGSQPQAWRDSVLGAACFGGTGSSASLPGIPGIAVDMATLGEVNDICEIWHCGEKLHTGELDGIRYRCGDNLLFGCLARPASADLQAQTTAAYNAIFSLLAAQDYSTVLRFWNYFPAINRESGGLERYRQFNAGRQDAFLAHGHSVIGNVPAACALGSASGNLNIAFLAMRGDVHGIENPRQVSAYHYPSQYGPRSPTFSRAGLTRLSGHDMLFVSGTASIVGHQTCHAGDVLAQARESMTNVAAVLEVTNSRIDTPFRLADLAYKVYLRRAEDFEPVRACLEEFVGAPITSVYLLADICRSDLLVEIEASAGHPALFP